MIYEGRTPEQYAQYMRENTPKEEPAMKDETPKVKQIGHATVEIRDVDISS